MRSGVLAQNMVAVGKSLNDRRLRRWSRNCGVETMAMPQRGGTIEAIKRRAAEKKAAEEKKKAEARARAASRGCDRMR